MNRGVLQTSPAVEQIIAGNPIWWNINNMRPPTHQQTSPFVPPPNLFPQFIPSSSSNNSSSSSSSSLTIPSWHDNNQEQLPDSWSQLLLGGLVDEDKGNMTSHFQTKKFENWEEQMLHHQASSIVSPVVDVKQENSATSYVYGHANSEDFQTAKPSWSQMIPPPVSSPKSCVTTSFSSNMLDFSTNKGDCRHPPPDRSSECNSTATGGAVKKARVQPSSTQSTFKVRKEKLGDRITALHQLVSPFGKTDTASVLLEAIGYIRFLQNQIEALSLPYLGSGSSNMRQQQQSVQGERNCIFPEDPGQLLNDNCIKRKGASDQQDCNEEPKKDLRSRGLCLVPVSCTLQVGSDNGADYWAPALGGGFR
ncbi:transcription factor, putative [Ricinus communis]|uniref:Transcription factor, putative n=1 Tax=Ricinus communis TaxID=3988 RepID=B9RKM4_RICCO|nr:transcription factor, putative [Ricinus communis]|eukprot:XP_002514268.1 transcription factor bHLH68 [Ricinus communis]